MRLGPARQKARPPARTVDARPGQRYRRLARANGRLFFLQSIRHMLEGLGVPPGAEIHCRFFTTASWPMRLRMQAPDVLLAARRLSGIACRPGLRPINRFPPGALGAFATAPAGTWRMWGAIWCWAPGAGGRAGNAPRNDGIARGWKTSFCQTPHASRLPGFAGSLPPSIPRTSPRDRACAAMNFTTASILAQPDAGR